MHHQAQHIANGLGFFSVQGLGYTRVYFLDMIECDVFLLYSGPGVLSLNERFVVTMAAQVDIRNIVGDMNKRADQARSLSTSVDALGISQS